MPGLSDTAFDLNLLDATHFKGHLVPLVMALIFYDSHRRQVYWLSTDGETSFRGAVVKVSQRVSLASSPWLLQPPPFK